MYLKKNGEMNWWMLLQEIEKLIKILGDRLRKIDSIFVGDTLIQTTCIIVSTLSLFLFLFVVYLNDTL